MRSTTTQRVTLMLLGVIILFGLFFLATGHESDTRNIRTRYQLISIAESLSLYKKDHGDFPTEEHGGLGILIGSSAGTPYIRGASSEFDAWGNKIVYRYRHHETFDLYSPGENKVDEHGLGDDLNYWDPSVQSLILGNRKY